jgi:hypothetical protein
LRAGERAAPRFDLFLQLLILAGRRQAQIDVRAQGGEPGLLEKAGILC